MVDLERIKWEGPDALTPGRHTVEFDFKYDGLGAGTLAFNDFSGVGRPGTGTLKVDGKVVDTKTMPKTLPMILQWDESFDVGSDTLTGVNDADYQPPFALTAKLNKLTVKLDRPQLSKADIAKFEPSIRLKMANVYRERQKWEEAQKQFDWILSDPRRQNTLDFQIQAAEMLQAAATAASDKTQKATFLAQAINGYKRPGKPKEAWAWGWAVLSNRLEAQAFNGADEKAMEARDRFYQARLNVLKCRLERAEALPQDREKELQKAFDYVDFTFKTHSDLGGPALRKQFDKLLKEIEKRQNKPVQKGIDGLKEAAEALSAAG
jgi:hypothetical protein